MAAGFMSYAHIDDADKRLTELCRYLAQEVQRQTGEEFKIFQDRADIGVGQQWRPRIGESIDSATFLIAFLSPGFFKSTECGREVALFLKREKQLRRNDLILPIYFIDYPAFNSAKNGAAASLECQLANRQFADWREVRFEPLGSPVIGK
jgi:F-box protein 11